MTFVIALPCSPPCSLLHRRVTPPVPLLVVRVYMFGWSRRMLSANLAKLWSCTFVAAASRMSVIAFSRSNSLCALILSSLWRVIAVPSCRCCSSVALRPQVRVCTPFEIPTASCWGWTRFRTWAVWALCAARSQVAKSRSLAETGRASFPCWVLFRGVSMSPPRARVANGHAFSRIRVPR